MQAWLDRAAAADAAEDATQGAEHRGDEMPDWAAHRQQRLARIRAARAALEAEAKQDPQDLDPDGPGPSSSMKDHAGRSGPPMAGRRPGAAQLRRPRQPYPGQPGWLPASSCSGD